jgi:dihydrolipoamide dehydrogenase
MSNPYDVVIIGSGPGGYVCAIKCVQLGLKTAIVEKEKTLGGTCLNIGCIPSKALLHASEMFAEAGHGLAKLGVITSAPKLDLKAMMAHKDAVVKANVDGVAFLMKKNKIDVHFGVGSIPAIGKVRVGGAKDSETILDARNIVIATGSCAGGIPGVKVEIDEKTVLTSTGALELARVPEKLIVVGGGVIGLELGSVWARLGAKVTVIEYLDKILGPMDAEISRQAMRVLQKQGIEFQLSAKVTAVAKKGKGATVTFAPVDAKQGAGKGGAGAKTLVADAVLISTGRLPVTDGLGLDSLGVTVEKGRVKTDGHGRTNVAGIFAIGDAIDGPMLAHKAEDEGVAVAETIAGQQGHVNYGVIPSVVYTQPEVASVGRTEEELKAAGIAYVAGKFPFSANGRARAMNHTDGLVKILADKATDRVLGVHILGFGAGEMIHEAAVLMEFGGSSEDLARTCHAHPTMSEAVREAALGTFAKSIHI